MASVVTPYSASNRCPARRPLIGVMVSRFSADGERLRRSYRAGQAFAIPLPGGRSVEGIVLEAGGAVAVVAVAGAVLRVNDRALDQKRWPLAGRLDGFDRATWPAPESRFVDAAETVADRARAFADGVPWVRPRIVVRDGVVLEPAPDPRLLRVVGKRTDVVDAAALAGRDEIAAIDVAGVTLLHPELLAALPSLRALRLTAVRFGDDLEWLAPLPLTHLYLAGIYRVGSLEPLARMRALRELEIRDAWQFHIDAMDWRAVFGRLDAFTIDLGSRRKNAEIYRAFAPPFPVPFERAVR